MDRKLEQLEANMKIIMLFDKWRYVAIDLTNDGIICRNLIQGKAIATAYQQKNYVLINQIVKTASGLESLKYFYKLIMLFSTKRYLRTDIHNFKNEWASLNSKIA
jgi:hypothetical protein